MNPLKIAIVGLTMISSTTLVCADVVTDWNVLANTLVAVEATNPPKLRTLAIMHVAMSDAINTVQNRYARVVATIPLAPDASAEAAAAAAARHILTQIY